MNNSIRTAIIGAGYRGKGLLNLLSKISGFHIVAVFDPDRESIPQGEYHSYSGGNYGYRQMIDNENPELVFIASPWLFHTEQAQYALSKGCHIAIEIKGGLCIDEYKDIIRTAQSNNLKIYPMENTVFMRENMAIINMVHQGVFGQIIAMKGGYRHDLRKLLIDDNGVLGNDKKLEGIWRSKFYQTENADIYPTHGLAPLCLAANIGRTDHISRLTAFASRAMGISTYIKDKGGDHTIPISLGDIIITQVQTTCGILITLTHDTTLPRPRSLDYSIQGTRGIWDGENRRIYLENISPYETWENDEKYLKQYESSYWKEWGEKAMQTDHHHKGMDYIMLRAIAEDLRGNTRYPIQAHDLALWTSITPLSSQSIKDGKSITL